MQFGCMSNYFFVDNIPMINKMGGFVLK